VTPLPLNLSVFGFLGVINATAFGVIVCSCAGAPPTAVALELAPVARAIPAPARAVPVGSGSASATGPADLPIDDPVVDLDTGVYGTCAVRRSGAVLCWGSDPKRELERPVPTPIGAINDAEQVSTHMFSAAVTRSGKLLWWGVRRNAVDAIPFLTKSPISVATGVSIGFDVCWIENHRDARCAYGLKGVSIKSVRQVSLGELHGCVLHHDGEVSCWGNNFFSQVNDSGKEVILPVRIAGLKDVVQISAGKTHTCALLANGTVACWGSNRAGELGHPQEDPIPTPALSTSPTPAGGREDDQAPERSCAPQNPSPLPVPFLQSAIDVSSGSAFTCAVLQNHEVQCWGSNYRGVLGDRSGVSTTRPVTVKRLGPARRVSAGANHVCALLLTGQVACWGDNGYWQLGDGTNTGRYSPVLAKLP